MRSITGKLKLGQEREQYYEVPELLKEYVAFYQGQDEWMYKEIWEDMLPCWQNHGETIIRMRSALTEQRKDKMDMAKLKRAYKCKAKTELIKMLQYIFAEPIHQRDIDFLYQYTEGDVEQFRAVLEFFKETEYRFLNCVMSYQVKIA